MTNSNWQQAVEEDLARGFSPDLARDRANAGAHVAPTTRVCTVLEAVGAGAFFQRNLELGGVTGREPLGHEELRQLATAWAWLVADGGECQVPAMTGCWDPDVGGDEAWADAVREAASKVSLWLPTTPTWVLSPEGELAVGGPPREGDGPGWTVPVQKTLGSEWTMVVLHRAAMQWRCGRAPNWRGRVEPADLVHALGEWAKGR